GPYFILLKYEVAGNEAPERIAVLISACPFFGRGMLSEPDTGIEVFRRVSRLRRRQGRILAQCHAGVDAALAAAKRILINPSLAPVAIPQTKARQLRIKDNMVFASRRLI